MDVHKILVIGTAIQHNAPSMNAMTQTGVTNLRRVYIEVDVDPQMILDEFDYLDQKLAAILTSCSENGSSMAIAMGEAA